MKEAFGACEEVKKLPRLLQGRRFGRWKVMHGSYVCDKRIFWGVIVAAVAFFFLAWWLWGSSSAVLLSCPEDAFGGRCSNPWIDSMNGLCMAEDPALCEPEIILAGEVVGERPPWLVRNFALVVVILMVLGFAANHAVHNREWRPRRCPICGRWWK